MEAVYMGLIAVIVLELWFMATWYAEFPWTQIATTIYR